ncbi:MAG: 30S ribosomal protein S6 [Phototrophicaceae bacterium]
MKRSYEIPVVFRVMPDEETQQAIDQVVAWLENSTEGVEDAGSVTRIDRTRLGRRRLAYEIKGQRDGFYVLIYATVDARHLPEFELNMRLYEPVLRYLIVKDDAVVAVAEEEVVADAPVAEATETTDVPAEEEASEETASEDSAE